ncbi:MAG: glycosyltransferase family 2 protein [Planctomycetes bacterium]|nr:glycosyltransferase family 2 protein [Planctomycetota bacterium]
MPDAGAAPAPQLSIVVPAYNEVATIRQLIDRLHAVDFGANTEFIVVDDGSTDGTRVVLDDLHAKGRVHQLQLHERNQGKGAALKTGFRAARGEMIAIQDADLEYDPKEIPALLAPIRDGRADVVYGSRFAGAGPHRVLFFWHYVANRFLTLVSNMFTNLNLTDMETCYKAFRREVIAKIDLRERRFGVEPELTAKFAAVPGVRIYEVGISYAGRTYAEGKKITWRDGVTALWCILKYNLWA